jgi:hypothetical protein
MEATISNEAGFKESNRQRLSILKTLLNDAQRATELCDVWLESGHIADYRAWQTQVGFIETAEKQYLRFREETQS